MYFAYEFDFYLISPKWQMPLIWRACWLLPVIVFSKVYYRQEREDYDGNAVYCKVNIENLEPLKNFVNLENNVPRNFHLATTVGRTSSESSLASGHIYVRLREHLKSFQSDRAASAL